MFTSDDEVNEAAQIENKIKACEDRKKSFIFIADAAVFFFVRVYQI